MKIEATRPPSKFNSDLGILDLDWRRGGDRKNSGSYYTPSRLIDCLLDHALEPALKNLFPKNGSAQGSLTVCDPACGTGHFLVPEARRIAKRLMAIHSGVSLPEALREAVEHCIFGVDLDPRAVELCKFNLWREAGEPPDLPAILDRRILCGDSLFLSWPSAFAEVFAAGGFDAVLGNPPFINAIEGGISPKTKKRLAASGELRGTADLAFYFVRLAHEIAKKCGTVGLVLPKTFLNAEAAAALRERLRRERPPSMIHVPRRSVYFSGAAAYTCLVALGGDADCSVSDAEWPDEAMWQQGEISDGNWWRSVQNILGRVEALPEGDFVPLMQCFEVSASMTAGDAYAIKPWVRDGGNGKGLKLVTTGLIDPFACKWGKADCRYLGATFARPRIDEAAELSPSLAARIGKAAARPKLLVAGLCNRFEAFLDAEGEYLGAVSTYSIFHPEDDADALRRLCDWLNSPHADNHLQAELGAASVGGGFMTLKKKTLQELPIPDRS
jgi:hypothetical protein